MYSPPHFRETHRPALAALMRAHPLATVVAATAERVEAEHIPLSLLDEPDPLGSLQGHVARANPVWRRHGEGTSVLAVFQGPNAYVSPGWYPSRSEHGRVVPTWNYLIVHVRGTVRWIDDGPWLRAHLERATDAQEQGREQPWRVSEAPSDHIDRLLDAIVGLEIQISEITGKWKLSQNRHEADRDGAVSGLRREGGAAGAAVAAWMTSPRS